MENIYENNINVNYTPNISIKDIRREIKCVEKNTLLKKCYNEYIGVLIS